jgi:membrane-associated phospholipid phosphatase
MTIMLTDVIKVKEKAIRPIICIFNSIKITAGRPRPDMLSRCQPPADTRDPLFGLTSVDACTTALDSHIMIDGFKSFPSGHSSCTYN